jgi:hypothetical protein
MTARHLPDSSTTALADRVAVTELCDRYLLGLDDPAHAVTDPSELFTEDVVLDFPPGRHRGLPGLAEFTATFMSHWARTHHHSAGYILAPDEDRMSVTWSVIATHVHPDAPPPPASANHFHLGGRFTGSAVRTPFGWRIDHLKLRVLWTTGAGVPAIVASMSGTTH